MPKEERQAKRLHHGNRLARERERERERECVCVCVRFKRKEIGGRGSIVVGGSVGEHIGGSTSL